MVNKEINKKIMKAIRGEGNNMSLSDMVRELSITKDQARLAVAFLMGAKKLEEIKYGMAKVYFKYKKESDNGGEE